MNKDGWIKMCRDGGNLGDSERRKRVGDPVALIAFN